MKSMNLFLCIGLSCLLKPVFSAPISNNAGDSNPNLGQCQQQFGKAGTISKVIGILPIQGDFFHGTLTIGNPVLVNENAEYTPFTGANVNYYLKKEHKYYQLILESDSFCEAYLSEGGTLDEVVQLNWGQKPPMNSLTAMMLQPAIFPRTGCYVGAESGNAEILLMCEYPDLTEGVSLTDSYYQTLNHLQVLFSDDQMIEKTCAQIPATAVKNSIDDCRTGLKALRTHFIGAPVENDSGQSFSKGQL